ncbi:MAG: hypothetical protein V3T41_07535, partial [bacterium]
ASLEEQAIPLEETAVMEYGEAVNVAEAAGIDSEWSRKAYNQLLLIRPYEIVKYEDVGMQGFTSDTGWVVSNVYEDGWLDVNHDDAMWPAAGPSSWRVKDVEKVVARVPGDPTTIWGGALDETVYFRKKFSFTYDPANYEAVIQSRGPYKLYVKGALIGQTDLYAKDPWVKPDTYDVSSALHLGDNVVCVEVTRERKDSYGLNFALVPEGGFPSPEPVFEETGLPEEFGGVQPEEGEMPMEEWPPPEGEGELPIVPGEEAEFGAPTPAEEFAEPTPAPVEETPAFEESEPGPETTTEAEAAPESEGEEEALPVPGEGEGAGYEVETSGEIDFEAVGTPEELGDTGAAPEEEPLGEEF